jgi:hypothetical protein
MLETRCPPAAALCLLAGCSANQPLLRDAGFHQDAAAPATDSGAKETDAGQRYTPPPYVKAGTRLKLGYYDGGDGARSPYGFFDAKENTPCSFTAPAGHAADDKTLRCLPTSGASLSYMDANCMTAVVRRESCPVEGRSTSLVTIGTPTGTKVFELGTIQQVDMLFAKTSDGRCLKTDVTTGQQVQLVGAELPLERFVRGETRAAEPVPGSKGLTMSYTDGEDGSSIGGALFFEGSYCTPTSLRGSGAYYCVPERTAQANSSEFESTDCTGPSIASGQPPGANDSPLLVNDWETDEASDCEHITGYREVGEDAIRRSSKFQDMCLPVTPGETQHYYRQGATIEPAHFPKLDAIEIGSGRLRLTQFVASDGRIVGRGFGWRDTQLKFECEVHRSADGQLSCVPYEAGRHDYTFSDAKCTQPLQGFQTCQNIEAVRYTTESRKSALCPSQTDVTVRSILPYTGPVYHSDGTPNPTVCKLAESDKRRYYQLGAPLSPASLATLNYGPEP